MNFFSTVSREIKFLSRERSFFVWVFVVLCLSTLSVYSGLNEVKEQNLNIESLIEADDADRLKTREKLASWGSAAYYSFHFTYDVPSEFAFAALGQRDFQPWKHRIRMLALEGQIYERDAGNPVVALIGRFDFAFLSAFILPLVLIILLFDLRAREKTAGRKALLEASVGNIRALWLSRTCLRTLLIFIALALPLVISAFISTTPGVILFQALLCLFLYTTLWAALCYVFGARDKPAAQILMSLVGLWLCLAVIFPAGARLAIDKAVELPSGADILLLQRESVNDAWDLPREATMVPFFERHPQWSDYTPVESSFEWQWYYAFQQVGDQKAEELSSQYRIGKLKRDQLAAWVSVLLPPALLERYLQSLAGTDLKSSVAYEDRVRKFHQELRDFYYPKFFRNELFVKEGLENLPNYSE